MMNRRRLLSFCLLMIAPDAFSPAAKAGRFALRIDDLSGVVEPWPLVGGLPFPQGAIKDLAAVRITSGGREVPAQFDVAATWRDGSVRWALAGFTGKPGARYQVEYGPGVIRAAPAAVLRLVREADGRLTVDTGVVRWSSDFRVARFRPEPVAVFRVTMSLK